MNELKDNEDVVVKNDKDEELINNDSVIEESLTDKDTSSEEEVASTEDKEEKSKFDYKVLSNEELEGHLMSFPITEELCKDLRSYINTQFKIFIGELVYMTVFFGILFALGKLFAPPRFNSTVLFLLVILLCVAAMFKLNYINVVPTDALKGFHKGADKIKCYLGMVTHRGSVQANRVAIIDDMYSVRVSTTSQYIDAAIKEIVIIFYDVEKGTNYFVNYEEFMKVQRKK